LTTCGINTSSDFRNLPLGPKDLLSFVSQIYDLQDEQGQNGAMSLEEAKQRLETILEVCAWQQNLDE
jgi:hypothetical protein